MAWENFGWVWNVIGVQGSEYVVLLFLADQANAKGLTPRVKIDKIMRRCNLSRRSVFEYLTRLEQKGFIKRQREWTNNGDMDANTFQLNMTRYFPVGQYSDAMELWTRILNRLDKIGTGRIDPSDLRILRRVQEVYLQKNSRLLYVVTETDLYEEILFRNLPAIKEATVTERLSERIRRFEAFRRPFLK